MKDKNILDPDKIDFLRKLHNKVSFEVNGETYKFRNRVHLGSPISLAMFNIYLQFVM